MAGFENYTRDTAEIEAAIVRKGIALGIDWSDPVEVQALAHEALNHLADDIRIAASSPVNYEMLTKVELFGLAGVMLKTMAESAGEGLESHGGPVWKAFARALWAESRARQGDEDGQPG